MEQSFPEEKVKEGEKSKASHLWKALSVVLLVALYSGRAVLLCQI
jgi:hypothetical protein